MCWSCAPICYWHAGRGGIIPCDQWDSTDLNWCKVFSSPPRVLANSELSRVQNLCLLKKEISPAYNPNDKYQTAIPFFCACRKSSVPQSWCKFERSFAKTWFHQISHHAIAKHDFIKPHFIKRRESDMQSWTNLHNRMPQWFRVQCSIFFGWFLLLIMFG